MEWVFETLGIDRQADVKTIRKAYARAVKQCDQATEADRFQRIRQAYEWALHRAEHVAASAPQEAAVPEPEQAPAQPVRAPPARVVLADDAHGLASQVFGEFMEAVRAPGAAPTGTLLARFAQDARLTALDAKMVFEQGVLLRAFAAPADMALLDAASDLFAWETSNRHLLAVRADLVQRLHRQQILRRLLDNGDGADRKRFVAAVELYALCQRDPREKAMPWQVADVNRLLDRYASFRHELNERFGAEAFPWWQQRLRENATLLRAYDEQQQPPPVPAQHKPRPRQQQQRRSGGWSSFYWVFLLPLIGLIHLIGGGYLAEPRQRPAYEAPRTQITQIAQPTEPRSLLYSDADYRRASAENGDPQAQVRFVEQMKREAKYAADYRDVFALFQALADRGVPRAVYNQGLMYQEGQGVERDPAKAADLVQRAAAAGYAEAQFHLGNMYKDGIGLKVDAQLARVWWQRAAEQGHVLAQCQVGKLFAKGDGVEQSYLLAANWWGRAAAAGNADAQNAMGELSEQGLGVARNDAVALRWYRSAAAQGHVAALTSLASMYEQGVVAPRNPVIAYALLRLAAARKGSVMFNRTPAMARLEQQLSSAQQSDAALLAAQLDRGLSSRSGSGFIAALDDAAAHGGGDRR